MPWGRLHLFPYGHRMLEDGFFSVAASFPARVLLLSSSYT